MATKLTKEQVTRLEALNFSVKSPEDAKKAALAFLKKNDIEGVEDEDLSELIDMAEAFADDSPAEDEEEETEDEEEADEEEADADEEEEGDEEEEEEEEAPAPKGKKATPAAPVAKGKKAALPEPDDEEELDAAADEAEAKASKATPAKKAAKAAPAPAPKSEKKASAKKAAPAAAPAAVRGLKFDTEDKAHLKLLKPLFERFDAKHYEHKMGKDGVSIRLKDTESTNRTVFVYNGLRVVDGELKGMMNFNALRLGGRDADNNHKGEVLIRKTFEDNDDLLDRLVMEDTLPKIKSATVQEVIDMVDKLGDDMEGKLKKLDQHLNKNKANLEKNMGTTSKKTADAKPAAKAKGKAVKDDEEEEEETPAPKPAPKGKKAAPAPEPEPEEEAPAPKPKKKK